MLIDSSIFHYLNGLALKSLWFDAAAVFLAKYLPYVLIGVLFLFLLWNYKKYWKMVAGGFSAGILAWIITKIIRFFCFQPRPFAAGQVNVLLHHSPTSSFPSAHAAIFFAISTIVLLYCNKKVYPAPNRRIWCGAGVLFLVASLLIGVGRVFTGLHWPSDILTGITVGILSALLVHKLGEKYPKQRRSS